MRDPFATVSELSARLDWELSPAEESVALAALYDLSEDAKFYGSSSWTADDVPSRVKSIVLRAAARFMRNPDGYTSSRAGDESVSWSEGRAIGNAEFTEDEQDDLAALAGRGSNSIVSVQLRAWGPHSSGTRYVDPFWASSQPDAVHVPAAGGLFPFGVEGEF